MFKWIKNIFNINDPKWYGGTSGAGSFVVNGGTHPLTAEDDKKFKDQQSNKSENELLNIVNAGLKPGEYKELGLDEIEASDE
jgi:hypothetical protein